MKVFDAHLTLHISVTSNKKHCKFWKNLKNFGDKDAGILIQSSNYFSVSYNWVIDTGFLRVRFTFHLQLKTNI